MAITFSNTDALTFLSALQGKSVDLVLTDPPYAISRKTSYTNTKLDKYKTHHADYGDWDRVPHEDHAALLQEVFQQFYRVLKPSGTVICWYDIWKLQELRGWAEEARFVQPRLVIWQKGNPVPINSKRNYLTNSREVAATFVKGRSPTFHSQYDNGIYHAPIHRDGCKRIHPTQKPLGVTSDLIKKHSNPGDIVLDTFAGSGTHLLAALQCGRHAWGCEPNPDYFAAARSRLAPSTTAFTHD